MMQPPSALPNRVLITILLNAFQLLLPVVATAPFRPKAATRGEPSALERSP